MKRFLNEWKQFEKELIFESEVSLRDYYSQELNNFSDGSEIAYKTFKKGKIDVYGYLKILNEMAEKLYKFVGRGSFRKVYQMDDGRVLKVATKSRIEHGKNTGIPYNAFEARRDFSPKFQDIIPRVEEVGPADAWIIMEKLHICEDIECVSNLFPDYDGPRSEAGGTSKTYEMVNQVKKYKRDPESVSFFSENLKKLAQFIKEYSLNVGDILREGNIGYDEQGDMKLVDYSF